MSQPCIDYLQDMLAGNIFCKAIVKGVVGDSTEECWLGNSGATTHITNHLARVINTRLCKIIVTVSTGEVAIPKTVGNIMLQTES